MTPTEKFTLSIANQITYFNGGSLDFINDGRHYNLDSGVDQTVLKNGVRGTIRLDGGWAIFGGVALTEFLNDAAVESWVSPEAGFSMTHPSGSGFQLGFTGDFGDDYSAYGIRLLVKWAF